MKHAEPSPLAGQTVRIKSDVKHPQYPNFGGSDFKVEDWWDRVAGKSWMFCDGNPGCIVYAIRTGLGGKVPTDDEVLYGKVGSYGSLVHIGEIEVVDSGVES